jgi:hypothetical protein
MNPSVMFDGKKEEFVKFDLSRRFNGIAMDPGYLTLCMKKNNNNEKSSRTRQDILRT